MKQDLRDKLLKAGLVDKKAKKRADHRARLKRTEDQKKGVDQEAVQEQKDRDFEEREEKRRRRDKERERARHQERQERKREQTSKKKEDSGQIDRKHKARDLLQASWFLPQEPGPVNFNFVSRSGGIRKLQVSTRIAHDLRSGQLAIAQLPGAESFGLVRRDVAEQLLADDPALVRFFVSDSEEELVEAPPVDDEA